MAKTAPRVFRHGTARDLARIEDGYSGTGESMHSRYSAHGVSGDGRSARIPPKDTKEFLATTTKLIEKLRGNISLERNPDRKAKLQRDFELKTALAQRLENELFRDGHILARQ